MGVHKIEYLLNKFIRLSNTTVSFILHLCIVKCKTEFVIVVSFFVIYVFVFNL